MPTPWEQALIDGSMSAPPTASTAFPGPYSNVAGGLGTSPLYKKQREVQDLFAMEQARQKEAALKKYLVEQGIIPPEAAIPTPNEQAKQFQQAYSPGIAIPYIGATKVSDQKKPAANVAKAPGKGKVYANESEKQLDLLKGAIEKYEKQPRKFDLTPLIALTDAWTGSNMARSYERPQTKEERDAQVLELKMKLADKYADVEKQKTIAEYYKESLGVKSSAIAAKGQMTDQQVNRFKNDLLAKPMYKRSINALAEAMATQKQTTPDLERSKIADTLYRQAGTDSEKTTEILEKLLRLNGVIVTPEG